MTNGQNIVLKRFENITKGANDLREYRGLELINGLKVLLISDPKTDKSAASLAVNVGHLMDPVELPGLAHFCEHMLFLGTDKYPVENEYAKFLSSHGGNHNAHTASDETNYYFDVKPSELEGALDRFVQFFLCPQFTASATEREVCAVDSEHSNNINHDAWRMLQIERHLSKDGHDYKKFGTGNKKTLFVDAKAKGIEPRDALLAFHKKWYSSNLMTLAILGKESLDDLERYLGTLEFSAIENKNMEKKVWKESPYGPEQLGTKIELVPVKDMKTLKLSWPIPDTELEYKSQPAHFISHLLGHEGHGSLLSELKKLGWVSGLSAGSSHKASGFSCFEVTMDLSVEGIEHTDDIVELVYNYIGLIEQKGVEKWIFDELSSISAIKFRFHDKENPQSYVTHLTSHMRYIPMEDIVSHPYQMENYRPERIKEILGLLKPDRMLYRVAARKFAGQEGNTNEPVYGTEWRRSSLSKEQCKKFTEALSSSHPALRIPEKNDYIPSKFELKERDALNGKHPRIIQDDSYTRAWFKQDDEFNMPKSQTKIALTTPIIGHDPRTSIMSSLWLWNFKDTLTEETYNADLAGLKYDLDLGPSGVQLRIHGYDEKQALFAKHLIERMVTFKLNPTRFEVLLELIRRTLANFSHNQPYSVAQYFATLLLKDKAWSKEQLLEVSKHVTMKDVEDFPKEMFKAFHVELLVHGNSTEKEAAELARDVTAIIKKAMPNTRPLYWNETREMREMRLENGEEYIYRQAQKTHGVSCVEVIYQVGVQSNKEIAHISLIEQLTQEPSFNILRTNEQLGYIVFLGTRLSAGSISLSVLVQGPKKPDFVLERIEAFMDTVRTEIENMPEEEFQQQVNGLIHKLEEKPKTLEQRFNRFWGQIDNRQYNFDRRDEEIAVLKNTTKEQIVELFNRKFASNAPEKKKIAIFIHGKEDGADEIQQQHKMSKKEKEISYCEQLRITHGYYARPEPKIDLKPIGVDPLHEMVEDAKSSL